MNKRFNILFFFTVVNIVTIYAQWSEKDSLNLEKILSGDREIKLNPEAIEKILLESPISKTPELLKPLLSTDKPVLEFSEELPTFFTDSLESKKFLFLTLKPYSIYTRWNEDPIYGGKVQPYVWPMATKEYSRSQTPQRSNYANSFPFAGKGGGRPAPSAGAVVSFSMEDVLQNLFSKKGRARLRNAKHANAWKNY